jgi:uncharacterized protein (TIGR04255 family)
MSSDRLPEFERPPVAEVVLSTQFEELSTLTAPQLGLLWSEFRREFPTIEEHAPIAPAIERFDERPSEKIPVRFEALDVLPSPRLWFVNSDGTQLIQVQRDRFIHNWRKTGAGDTYPRYEKTIRPRYQAALHRFSQFLEREKLGILNANQCEITYVNHISAEGWKEHGDLHRVISPWSGSYSDDFLTQPETVSFALRYKIPNPEGKPIGRLHVQLEPGFNKQDQKPMFIFTLTARGRPIGDGQAGIFAFLDIGRKWIVKGFTSLTTKHMHDIWGRLDAQSS